MGPCLRHTHTWDGITSGSKRARRIFPRTGVRRPVGTSAETAGVTCSQSTKKSRGRCGTCRPPSKESPLPTTRAVPRSTSSSSRSRLSIESPTLCRSTRPMRHRKPAPLHEIFSTDNPERSAGTARAHGNRRGRYGYRLFRSTTRKVRAGRSHGRSIWRPCATTNEAAARYSCSRLSKPECGWQYRAAPSPGRAQA